MATIDDFGGTTDPLNAPPLGGPTGWAAAVRDYLKGSVVQKAGDVISGSLQVIGGINTPSLTLKEGALNLHESGGELVVWDIDRSTYGKAFVDTPTATMHAATKSYADQVFGGEYMSQFMTTNEPLPGGLDFIPFNNSTPETRSLKITTFGGYPVVTAKVPCTVLAVLQVSTITCLTGYIRLAQYNTAPAFAQALGLNAFNAPATFGGALVNSSAVFNLAAGESIAGNIHPYQSGQFNGNVSTYPTMLQVWRLPDKVS